MNLDVPAGSYVEKGVGGRCIKAFEAFITNARGEYDASSVGGLYHGAGRVPNYTGNIWAKRDYSCCCGKEMWISIQNGELRVDVR